MPNWSDENGRFWYTPPGKHYTSSIEVPHPPVSVEPGCTCAFCTDKQPRKPAGDKNRALESARTVLKRLEWGIGNNCLVCGRVPGRYYRDDQVHEPKCKLDKALQDIEEALK